VKPELSAQQAADRYTRFSDRVAQEDLEEALGYFEYAVAAYYVVVSLSIWSGKPKKAGEFGNTGRRG